MFFNVSSVIYARYPFLDVIRGFDSFPLMSSENSSLAPGRSSCLLGRGGTIARACFAGEIYYLYLVSFQLFSQLGEWGFAPPFGR